MVFDGNRSLMVMSNSCKHTLIENTAEKSALRTLSHLQHYFLLCLLDYLGVYVKFN